LNLDLFLLFVEVVENGLAFEGQDLLLVLFVETAVKTICMFTSSLVLLKVLALPEKMVFAIGFMMGWPQMVTGICGILLARLITKRTANF